MLKKQETIKELEDLARKVLMLKKDSLPRRPIVIEFCGSPKSGKSTCINSLDLFLRRNKFRTKVLNERAGICPIKNKFDPLFNVWTMTSAIAELSECISNHSRDYDVIILDRGLFDAICWFTWQRERDFLHEEDFKSFIRFITTLRWRSAIDIIYTFTSSPKVSLDREHATLLTSRTGSVMRPKVLHSFNDTIVAAREKYSFLFRNIQHIDTTHISHNEVNYKVTNEILNKLYELTVENIGYFVKSDIRSSGEVFRLNDSNLKDLALNFGKRDTVEKCTDYVQPIPIAIVTDTKKSRILIGRKKRERTSQRSPEKDKNLIYFGGHIREEDRLCIEDKKTFSSIKQALFREIKEELGIDFHPCEDDPLCIWLQTHETSKKHIAICFLIEKDIDFMNFTLDMHEFTTTGKNRSGRIVPTRDIVNRRNQYEYWSQIILREIFDKEIAMPQMLFPSE